MSVVATPKVRRRGWLLAACLVWVGVLLLVPLVGVVITALFGVVVAWVLVRQRFWGRSLLNATVDLPFALSPVTVGLAALVLFGPGGWLASFFESRGIQIIFALPSMTLVTIFICVPFTIREIVPVLE